MIDPAYAKTIVHSAIYDRVVAAARGQLTQPVKPASPHDSTAVNGNSNRSGK
jgi:hypothetical protein